MRKPEHPIQILNNAFAKYFTKQYQKFVDKKKGSTSVKELSQKIEKETVKLRQEHSDEAFEINFSDKILGDAKRFIAILLFIAMRFYVASLKYEDILRSLL